MTPVLTPQAIEIIKEYARVNIQMAGDGVLFDPVLGRGFGSRESLTQEGYQKSEEMITHSCIHSSKYHAAKDLLEIFGIDCSDI